MKRIKYWQVRTNSEEEDTILLNLLDRYGFRSDVDTGTYPAYTGICLHGEYKNNNPYRVISVHHAREYQDPDTLKRIPISRISTFIKYILTGKIRPNIRRK